MFVNMKNSCLFSQTIHILVQSCLLLIWFKVRNMDHLEIHAWDDEIVTQKILPHRYEIVYPIYGCTKLMFCFPSFQHVKTYPANPPQKNKTKARKKSGNKFSCIFFSLSKIGQKPSQLWTWNTNQFGGVWAGLKFSSMVNRHFLTILALYPTEFRQMCCQKFSHDILKVMTYRCIYYAFWEPELAWAKTIVSHEVAFFKVSQLDWI